MRKKTTSDKTVYVGMPFSRSGGLLDLKKPDSAGDVTFEICPLPDLAETRIKFVNLICEGRLAMLECEGDHLGKCLASEPVGDGDRYDLSGDVAADWTPTEFASRGGNADFAGVLIHDKPRLFSTIAESNAVLARVSAVDFGIKFDCSKVVVHPWLEELGSVRTVWSIRCRCFYGMNGKGTGAKALGDSGIEDQREIRELLGQVEAFAINRVETFQYIRIRFVALIGGL
jgi:hypothetical protein